MRVDLTELIQQAPIAVALLDDSAALVSANRPWERWAEATLLLTMRRGLALPEALPEAWHSGWPSLWEEALTEGSGEVIWEWPGRADSPPATYQVELWDLPLTQSGAHFKWLAVRDYSEESQTLATLRRDLRSARSSLATRDTVLSVLGHDLRAPIARLNALLLRLSDVDVPEVAEQAHHLAQATRGLGFTLENLLAWAGAQRRAIEPRWRKLDAATLLQELVEIHVPIAAERGIALVADLEETPIYTDAGMLVAIARNLLGNALKYTGRGGTVRVRHGLCEHGYVLDVEDDGVGMSALERARALDDAAPLHAPAESLAEGLGLGLKLSLQFARLMGGQLTLESQPGAGTTATLSIPQLELPSGSASAVGRGEQTRL